MEVIHKTDDCMKKLQLLSALQTHPDIQYNTI